MWPNDYLKQSSTVTTTLINWGSEMRHGYECVNVHLARCGDGVLDSSNGEQCDLGTQNGKP